jgi:hypothetical protein
MMAIDKKPANKLVIFFMLCLSFTAFAQDKHNSKGTVILWQEPADITTRDLYLGPGGEAMKPDLSRVVFIKEGGPGYSKKYHVKDGAGNEWVAKIGKEAQTDTVASRLLWAVGYDAEISYLVPRVTIEGKGTFENVRFEARPKHIKRDEEWRWNENPFYATREFQGLKVMMVLLNNWDIKDSNNKVLIIENPQTGETERHYIISDLGGTLGKTGGIASRSRNEPEDYFKAKFIDEVKKGRVYFHYGGKRQDLFRDITVEQAVWIGTWLSKLSEQQIRDAFRAANYNTREVEMYTQVLQARIGELVNLTALSPGSKP